MSPLEPTAQRIVDSAVQLAAAGGFQGVRLRDVAQHSGVSLGSVYRYFESKEDMLLAALERETHKMMSVMRQYPAPGETPAARVDYFFGLATRGLVSEPHFARAVLRSLTSADPVLTEKVARFHSTVTQMITEALRGPSDSGVLEPSASEIQIGMMLQRLWFASLVGWMGGIHDDEAVIQQMQHAARVIIVGVRNTFSPDDEKLP
jgi:AcrR family transcriptional regulator